MINDCQPDPERLAVVSESMENHNDDDEETDDEDDPYAEWRNSILSPRTIVYSCGTICREGDVTEHCHEEAEFALCRRLANEAVHFMDGVDFGIGSSNIPEGFPFYIVATAGDSAPLSGITPESIRQAFGGTLCPPSPIEVNPLTREGAWGDRIREYYMGEEEPLDVNVRFFTMQMGDEATARAKLAELDDGSRATGERWFALGDWFAAQPELHGAVFVSVCEPDEDSYLISGVTFPRLAVALTAAGSIVGLYYNSVHA